MILDVFTVFFATILVAVISGVLMIFAGRRSADAAALNWWGAGNLVAATGASLIAARGGIPDVISIGLANALLAVSNAMFWNAARLFRDRPAGWSANWPVLAAGPMAWLAACLFPAFYEHVAPRIVLASVIIGAYAFCAAYEFWRVRETLFSRKAAIVLLTLHGVYYTVRSVLTLAFWPTSIETLLASPWVMSMAIVSMVHLVAMSVLLVAMSKERAENLERMAASTDNLTGIPNRRYFLQEAVRRLSRCARTGAPAAVLMIDLDNFKRVNDRHGHARGDHVLRMIAEAVVDNLRPDDLAGRIGGDEFACCLTRCSDGEARMIAERLRCKLLDIDFDVTLSVGIATARTSGYDIDAMLRHADRSMYHAKHSGKNRIVAY